MLGRGNLGMVRGIIDEGCYRGAGTRTALKLCVMVLWGCGWIISDWGRGCCGVGKVICVVMMVTWLTVKIVL